MERIARPAKREATPAPLGRICGNCRYFCELGDVNGSAECRRKPPLGTMIQVGPQGQMAGIGFFPSTRAEQWCGDWETMTNS